MQRFEDLRQEMEVQFNRLQALGDYDANAGTIRAVTEAILVTMIKLDRLEVKIDGVFPDQTEITPRQAGSASR